MTVYLTRIKLVSPAQRLTQLRVEADNAVERAEAAEAKNKTYEQQLLERDQEIQSLQHKLSVMDAELEKAEGKITEMKAANQEGDAVRSTSEGLQRKIQLLEEELDAAEKNVKETVEKCVHSS
jgi:tropomyosin, fungi type